MDSTLATSASHQIVFIDAAVSNLANIDALLAQIDPTFQVLHLSADAPALAQMAAALQGVSGIEAIHLISHGSAGNLNLAGGALTSAALADSANADALTTIRASLSDHADFLLYGCDVGAGASGQAFLAALASATGADVAASTNATGAAVLGGDWTLEAVTGSVEAPALALDAMHGLLVAPTINNLNANLAYVEGGAAVIIDSDVSFTGGSAYGGGYMSYSLASANVTDQLVLTSSLNPNASGEISVVAGVVYMGNGSSADPIGSIDVTQNGVNGQPLKINFTAAIANPGFETGGGSVTGWTIGDQQVYLGSTVIGGYTTPLDGSLPSTTSNQNTPTSSTFSHEVATPGSDSPGGGGTGGNSSLRLFSNMGTAAGFDVVNGPYAMSNSFRSAAGDVLFFDWKAAGGSDAYDAFGYLLNMDNGSSSIVINQTGADAAASTAWATLSVTVPTTGNYAFVFVSGTWDATGGQAAGGSLYVDNFKVFSNSVTNVVAETIARQVTYQNTGTDVPTSRVMTLTAADGAGASSSVPITLDVTLVNNAPTFTSGATLTAVSEDATNPAGASVTTLFGALFSDPDTVYVPADTLAGIAITLDASTIGQGVWQYSTDSGSNWLAVGAVSTGSALLLSTGTLLRFLPAADYNGAPGSLSVHAVDSSGGLSFTSGATRLTFDTTTDDGTSPVSAGAVALITSVASVNDAPVYTSGAVTLALTDTAALDVFSAQTGTIVADDTHAGAPNESGTLTYGISGGTLGGGFSTSVGTYGTLAVNTSSGAYTFTPNAATINALSFGSNPVQTFTVTVSDGQGGSTNQTFTVNVAGQNDNPIGVNDTGTALEASGAANATLGSNASGNVLSGAGADSDIDTGSSISVTAVRTGSVEGSGVDAGAAVGSVLTLAGSYGTLSLNVNGSYTYVINENDAAVQALNSGSHLTETFNYSVTDDTSLSDIALLAIQIDGANDLPTIAGIVSAAAVVEDLATALPLNLTFVDPDSASSTLRLQVDAGTLRATSSDVNVVIVGSDGGTLSFTATSPLVLNTWLAANPVYYVTAPNQNGVVATLSYALNDGSGFIAVGSTTTITASAINDGPIVDVGGVATAGNDFSTTFRPRGPEVLVVGSGITITDIDSTTIQSATVSLTAGAADNDFGTIYETLQSTLVGNIYVGTMGDIAITGNGTGTNALTGATVLMFTGAGSHVDYQNVLQTVSYNNANPNAFAGDRTITVALVDDAGQTSNTASFATAAANLAIAVGQRIFVDGSDSGQTVAVVLDSQHFVASGPLTALVPDAVLSFRDVTGVVTTAVQAGPTVATVTMLEPWTPVMDMNGGTLADGRNYAVTYIEGDSAVAIATADASITDQGGLIHSITATLTNPLDGVHEQLQVSGSVITALLARGIVVSGNNSAVITFTAAVDTDATNFQIALRGVKYSNDSQNPDTTQRVVTVSAIDADSNIGVSADTIINVIAVNDAPDGINSAVSALEDTNYTFGSTDFGFSDPVDATGVLPHQLLAIKISTLPASGVLQLDSVAVTVGQIVSLTDILANKLVYVPVQDHSGSPGTTFTFQVQDNGGTANGGINLDPTAATMTINIAAVNDAPVLTAAAPQLTGITEDAVASVGNLVSDLVGSGVGKTGIADVDVIGMPGEFTGQGIAVHGLGNAGPGAGTWQYSLNGGGSWSAVNAGTAVDVSHALLLGASDKIRFVPDQANASVATISYYLWDGASGAAGQKVDASIRGTTTAFSVAGDTASITVSAVNDAPVIDLNGGTVGIDGSVDFNARGGPVPLFDAATLFISDVDDQDHLTSATLVMDATATLDNVFGTTYETLSSTLIGGIYAGTMGNIAITGNGTEDSPLQLNGNGTVADYKAALLSVVYNNANPNAFAGIRPVAVTVHDAGIPVGGATDSVVATLDVNVHWAAVADLNGEAAAGSDYTVSYTENNPGLAIAATDASLVDQDGNIKSVTATLTNAQDGVAGALETLFISAPQIVSLAAIGITVTGNNSHAITLNGDRDGTVFQLGLRAIQYTNGSDNPNLTQREVVVSSVDMQDHVGVAATTFINPLRVNDVHTGSVTISNDTDALRAVTTAQQNDVLLAANTLGDPDGMDPLTVTYQWLRDGVAVDGAIGATYALTQADVGKAVTVVATYTDSGATVEHVSSSATNLIVNVNDAPVAVLDVGTTSENVTLNVAVLSGLLVNDLDPDPLDTHVVSAVNSSGANVGAGVAGTGGGLFTIAADGSYSFDPGLDFDSLAVGESRITSIEYTNEDNVGDSSSSTLTVTVTGTNDAPLVAVIDVAGAVAELVTASGNLTDTGTITFTDVDLTDVHSVSAIVPVGTPLGTLTASVSADTVNGTGGVVTWDYSVAASAVEYLALGQTKIESFSFNLEDGHGGSVARTVDVTITGTNDAPLVSLIDVSGAVTELVTASGNLTDTGALTFTDADLLDVHSISAVTPSGTPLGTLTASVSADTVAGLGGVVTWNYSVAASAVEYLAAGETRIESFSFNVLDDQGGSVARTVDVIITGTNDAPLVALVDVVGAVTESVTPIGNLADTGTLTFTDVDLLDVHSVSAVTPVGTPLGTLTASVSADTVAGLGGVVMWDYSVAASAVEYLAAGETRVESFSFNVLDNHGASVARTVNVTITGTNDAPLVALVDVLGTVTELVTASGNLTDTGTITFTDVDLLDVHSVSAVTPSGTPLGTLTASVSADTVAGLGGVVTWNYSVAASAVEYLAAGETRIESFSFNLEDGHGGSIARTVDVTITGTNDAPQVTLVDVTGAVTELVTPSGNLTDTGTIAFTDVDLIDVHSVSAVTPSGTPLGTLVASVSVDTVGGLGGVVTWGYSVAASAVEYLAAGETRVESFSFNVLDNHGASVARTVNVTITGTNDAPLVALIDVTGTATELVTASGNLVDTGTITFTDVDLLDVHSVSAVTPSGTPLGTLTASVSADTVAGLGGVVTWNYSVAASAVEYLAAGEARIESFSFNLEDGHGGSVARTVNVIITGSNDAPLVSLTDVTGAVTELVTPSGNLTDTGTITFTDVDLIDVHSVSAVTPSGTPLGTLTASVSADTVAGLGGVVTWDYSVAASAVEYLATGETKVDSFSFNLQDGHGGSVARTVDITITGTNDAPVATNLDAALIGAVTEAGMSGAGTPTASGTLSSTDVDTGATAVWSLNGTPSTTYGTMAIDAGTGVWTYVLNNDLAATQALSAGQVVTQTYSARVTDDQGAFVDQTVTITITGTDDASVIIGTSTASLTETNAILIASGVLIATDVDSVTRFVAQSGVAGNPGYGTFSINAEGLWNYTTNNAHNEFVAEQRYTDSIIVSATDGTQKEIVVTIIGSNDAPTGTVVVRGAPIQGTTLEVTNTLADPDVPMGTISYQWQADGVDISGATGSTFTLTQAELAKAITAVAIYADGSGTLEHISSAAAMARAPDATDVPDASQSVVSTIEVIPTGSSTPILVALSLQTGSDVIDLTAHSGETVVIPTGMVTPAGQFDITGLGNVHASEHFSLYIDSSLAVNGYWVLNTAGILVNLASAPFGGSVVIEGDKIRLDFTITDGSEFDANATGGNIAATGLAGKMELSIIGHPTDVPVNGLFF
jgi:VCBS repeat-containing protein